jgi:hypothetical protein
MARTRATTTHDGLMDASEYLRSLVGTTIPTLTGTPNNVLRVEAGRVIVGTGRSPKGQPVPIADVQAAMDLLERDGEVVIDVATVGYRSAFIGAVLASLPGTTTSANPRTVKRRRDD